MFFVDEALADELGERSGELQLGADAERAEGVAELEVFEGAGLQLVDVEGAEKRLV